MVIAVVGSNDCTPETEALAETVGREIARRGATLICGGHDGVMAAACRGARSEGGHTIGVLPEHDRSRMNRWVEFPVVTGMGEARNLVIVLSADAVLALDGSYGTLSEIAFALRFGKPVVGLGTWSISLEGREDPAVLRVDDPVAAVEAAVAAASSREHRE